MADIPFRRASLAHDDRPVKSTFISRLTFALSTLNWRACISAANIEEAEHLLTLSDRELEDLGLRRDEIHAYVFERPDLE